MISGLPYKCSANWAVHPYGWLFPKFRFTMFRFLEWTKKHQLKWDSNLQSLDTCAPPTLVVGSHFVKIFVYAPKLLYMYVPSRFSIVSFLEWIKKNMLKRDSNLRPLNYRSGALPTEFFPNLSIFLLRFTVFKLLELTKTNLLKRDSNLFPK